MFFWASIMMFLSPEAQELQIKYERNLPLWNIFLKRIVRLESGAKVRWIEEYQQNILSVTMNEVNQVFHGFTEAQIATLRKIQKNEKRRISLVHGNSQNLQNQAKFQGILLEKYNTIPMKFLGQNYTNQATTLVPNVDHKLISRN